MRAVLTMVTLALAATTALPASASTTGFGDPAGDANHLNDGGEFHTGNQVTPGSDPGLDLRSVRLSPLRAGRRTTGFLVTVTTTAPLRDGAQVTVQGRTATCEELQVRYVSRAPRQQALVSSRCGRALIAVPAKQVGNRLTITVPFSVVPPQVVRGGGLRRINAYSQIHLADEPRDGRPTGTGMVDTTLAGAGYAFG